MTLPRLFTALLPPVAATDALRSDLLDRPDWPPEGWRATPAVRWHLTLCFHGGAEPGVLARRLEERAAGLTAPWLRLAGAVSLPRVVAAGVIETPVPDLARERVRGPGPAPGDRGTVVRARPSGLPALVAAAGGDPARFRAHVTVARTSRRDDRPPAGGPLARHRGPWWCPEEVCLVLSEPTSTGPRHSVLHRVPLRSPAWAPPPARSGSAAAAHPDHPATAGS